MVWLDIFSLPVDEEEKLFISLYGRFIDVPVIDHSMLKQGEDRKPLRLFIGLSGNVDHHNVYPISRVLCYWQ